MKNDLDSLDGPDGYLQRLLDEIHADNESNRETEISDPPPTVRSPRRGSYWARAMLDSTEL